MVLQNFPHLLPSTFGDSVQGRPSDCHVNWFPWVSGMVLTTGQTWGLSASIRKYPEGLPHFHCFGVKYTRNVKKMLQKTPIQELLLGYLKPLICKGSFQIHNGPSGVIALILSRDQTGPRSGRPRGISWDHCPRCLWFSGVLPLTY